MLTEIGLPSVVNSQFHLLGTELVPLSSDSVDSSIGSGLIDFDIDLGLGDVSTKAGLP